VLDDNVMARGPRGRGRAAAAPQAFVITEAEDVPAELGVEEDTLQYAFLVLNRLEDAPQQVQRRNPRRQAQARSATTNLAMHEVLATLERFDRNVATSRDHLAVVLYTPRDLEDNQGRGMPAEEAMVYFSSLQAEVDLRKAARAAAGLQANSPVPRSRLRIDIWYTLRDARRGRGRRQPAENIPRGRLAGELSDAPKCSQGRVETIGDSGMLRDAIERRIHDFLQELEEIDPSEGSGRELDRVVCANVWFPRAIAPQAAGHVRRGFDPLTESIAECDGEHVMRRILWESRGLVASNPERSRTDKMCVARAIVTGLRIEHRTRADTHYGYMLFQADNGISNRIASLRRSIQSASPTMKARLQPLLDASLEDMRKIAAARHRLSHAAERYTRDELRNATVYKAIEADLHLAFEGRHPLVDFSMDAAFFSTAISVTAESVARIRRCIRDPERVALQFWGIGMVMGDCVKVGLNYPDTHANLEFAKAGGMVVNILVAWGHAEYIRNVSTLCNTQSSRGAALCVGRGRVHCGLCGSFVSQGNVGYQWLLYKHQLAGCNSTTVKTSFPTALSPRNLRQVGRRDLRLYNRELLVACLDTSERAGEDACTAIQLRRLQPEGWLEMHRHEPDEPYVIADDPDIYTCLKNALHLLFSPASLRTILDTLHSDVGMHPDRIAAMPPVHEHTPCFGCELPVLGPSKFEYQAKREAEIRLDPAAGDVSSGLPDVPEQEDSSSAYCDDAVETHIPRRPASDEEDDYDTRVADAEAGGEHTAVDAVVNHHCHGTGQIWKAHAACNLLMPQGGSTLWVNVGSDAACTALVRVLCSRSFIETFCNGTCPIITRNKNRVRTICVKVVANRRPFSVNEVAAARARGRPDPNRGGALKIVWLRVKFRMFDSIVPSWSRTHNEHAEEAVQAQMEHLLTWAELTFKTTGMWAPLAETYVTFSRLVLFDRASRVLGPGITPTSIVDAAVLRSTEDMVKGGMMILGERVEVSVSPEDIASRRRGVFYFDVNSAYGAVLKGPLPLLEHDDHVVRDFSDSLEDGILFLRSITVGDEAHHIYRFRVWGHFPPETHARLAALPPVYSKCSVTPSDLSRFQRLFMGIDKDTKLHDQTIGHFFPVQGLVVFAETARIWDRLGFRFTRIADVRATQAAPWGRPFADEFETLRRNAKATGDTLTVNNVKQAVVSIIGSLCMNTSKYTRLLPVAPWREKASVTAIKPPTVKRRRGDESDSDSSAPGSGLLSRQDTLRDKSAWTLRSYKAGDLLYYEMRVQHVHYTQQKLAALYIVEKQRAVLLELWYGNGRDWPGFQALFPGSRVVHGNTDSLLLDITALPEDQSPYRDVRHQVLAACWPLLDLSTVPETSSFVSTLPPDLEHAWTHTRTVNADRWGAWKEVTGMALIEITLNNKRNSFMYKVVQSTTDTPDDCKDFDGVTCVSVPRAWYDLASKGDPTAAQAVTMEAFAASWLNVPQADRVPVPALPTVRTSADLAVLPTTVETRASGFLSWGNKSCIVSRSPEHGFPQLPLGSQLPLAHALREGTEW
jgi:hypothetical protein